MRGRSEHALLLNYWKTRITHVQEICTFISDGSASACVRSSLVSSTNRCLLVLVTPSVGRYSTAYESYRGAESMLFPSFMRSLETNKRMSALLKSNCVNRSRFFDQKCIKYYFNIKFEISNSIYFKM